MGIDVLQTIQTFTGVTVLGSLTYGWRVMKRKTALHSEAPLDITVSEDVSWPGRLWTLVCEKALDRGAFLGTPGAGIGAACDPTQFRQALIERGDFYEAEFLYIDLTLTNKRPVPIWITGVEAIIEKSRPTPDGTLVTNPPQGEVGVRDLQVHLDQNDRRAKRRDDTDYFDATKLEIQPGGREFLHISAQINSGAVDWRLRVTTLVGNKSRIQLFPPAPEQPMRAAAIAGYRGGYQKEWVCSPLVAGCEDVVEPPHLHDRLLDIA